jgi:NhaA family Na+:H+ antiporter
VAWAVAAGLVLGKQAGVLGAVILAERSGLARRPEGATLLELWGVALLAGVGFTMSLFIAALAFPRAPELAAEARLGILGGSLVSALAGFVVLRIAAGRRAAG